MAVIQTTWNGYEVIGEKYKIKNVSNGDAVIKQIYLNNVNPHLLGNSNTAPLQGFIFYQNLYAFKFYNNPVPSSGVVVSDLDISFILSGTNIPVYQTPSIQNYPGYPGPMSRYAPVNGKLKYITGEGISVVNPDSPVIATINLFNQPLRDSYRAPKSYTLRPYSSTQDELEIFVIFTASLALKGLYEADLVINYEHPNGLKYTRKNTLKCVISDSNILEVDKTLEANIFSIDNIELDGNSIFIN